MSREEESNVHGRNVTEYLAAKNRLTALESQCQHIGNQLQGLGRALSLGNLGEYAQSIELLRDPEKIRSLVSELEAARDKKRNLLGQLRSLGLDIKE